MLKKLLSLLIFVAFFSTQAQATIFIGGGGAAVTTSKSVNFSASNLVALYSVIQQTGWSGNALRVQRSSDSTQQDIGFVNGVMDMTTALSFCGASTTCGVVTWYDQSGNGNDATQSTFVSAPALSSANNLNSLPGLTMWTTGTRYLTIPNTVTTSRQTQTIYSVQSMDAPSQNNAGVYEINTTLSTGTTLSEEPGPDQIINQGFQGTGLYSNSQPVVSVVTSGTSTATYQMNNKTASSVTTGTASTTTGGYIGSAHDVGYQFLGEMYLVAVYNTVQTQPTIASQVSNLLTTFNIPTTPNTRILFDGDSITQGYGSTLGINNPRQVYPQLTKGAYIRDIGIFGQLFSTMNSNKTSRVVNSYDASLGANIVVVAGGTNDITGGNTGTNVFNNDLTPYVAAAKTAGYQVIVGTLIYNSAQTTGQNTERQTYNSLVRANAATLGYTVVDYDSITQLQNPQTSGYSFDGTHPTTLGYALMANLLAPILNPLLQ